MFKSAILFSLVATLAHTQSAFALPQLGTGTTSSGTGTTSSRAGATTTSGGPRPTSTTITGSDITSDLIPNAINSVCGGFPGVAQAITLNFDTGIKFTAGDCPTGAGDNSTTTTLGSSSSSSAFSTSSATLTDSFSSSSATPTNSFLSARDMRTLHHKKRGGCNFPPNLCGNLPGGSGLQGFSRCGEECDSDCYWGDGGPDPNDCQVIFNNFLDRFDQVFNVGHAKFVLFTFASCGTGIQNQIATTSEECASDLLYDYTDWAGVGHFLATSCQAGQGARGGKCLAANTNSDFFLQVYKN